MNNTSNYTRGFRHGLRAAVQMIDRFKDSFEGKESIKIVLNILSNEIPQIGCTLGKHIKEESTDSEEEDTK